MSSDELLEYSVIYTDRAKNLMAGSFSQCMKDIMIELTSVYNCSDCIMIPGSGTYAMEAVAGQFVRRKDEANYKPCMVIRNGYFSFRWSDIFDWSFSGSNGADLIVMKAQPQAGTAPAGDPSKPQFAPIPIEDAVQQIRANKPAVVFAPHVETSCGMLLSHDYIKALAAATHEGGDDCLFVLDCIASGNVWSDMGELGIDVIITAPQKGWSGPCCVGIAMLSAKARALMDKQNAEKPRGHSLSCNLGKWASVADAYKKPGGFMYHTTLPTDALITFRNVIMETKAFGYAKCQEKAWELGMGIRAVLEAKGFRSVSAAGVQSPTVVVSYMRDANDKDIHVKLKKQGIQIATGVPLKIDEPWVGGPPS